MAFIAVSVYFRYRFWIVCTLPATAELYNAYLYDMTVMEGDTTDSLAETALSIIVHNAQKV